MKKIFGIFILLYFIGSQAISARYFELPVWNDNSKWSDATDARLHAYMADNPTGMAILVCPGGGYSVISGAGPDVAEHLTKEGISIFVLKYRLPKGRYEVPLADAEQAMRIIRNHAAEWGIDPHQVGVMGNSAGGHLAASLATLYGSDETRPDFQILLYPVITMDETYTHQGSRVSLLGKNPSQELVEHFSTEKQVKPQTPPAFVVVSAADDVVPAKNSLDYAAALIKNEVPVSLHVYPYGYHGFGYSLSFKDADIWHAELLRWIKRGGK